VVLFLGFISTTSKAQQVSPSMIEDVSYEFLEKLIAVAKENYPSMKAQQSKIKMAKLSVSDTKLSWLTPVGFSYVYSPKTTLNLENPTFFNGYQLGFSLNVGAILKTPIAIKQSKEQLKIANFDFEEAVLSQATEVKKRYFTYLLALRVLKMSTQIDLDAQSLLSKLKYKYERSEVEFETFNSALTSAINSTQSKFNAETSYLISKSSLEELLGIKLEQVPN
jgi:outer membrane protein TolC